jgi:hypothetical protein
MRTALLLACGVLLLVGGPGCRARGRCCGPAAPVVAATADTRRQVLVELSFYEVAQEVFLEMELGGDASPRRLEADAALRTGKLLVDKGATLLVAPSIVTRVGEEASVMVGETLHDGRWEGMHARLDTSERGGGLGNLTARITPTQVSSGIQHVVTARDLSLLAGSTFLVASEKPAGGRRVVAVVTLTEVPREGA